MLKQRRDAAQQLANRLFETERAIDEAIEKMADLTGYMPVARKNANLSAVVGQDVLSQAANTLTTLIEARGRIVETHDKLAVVRDQIGLREIALGSPEHKPPMAQVSENQKSVVTLVSKAA